MLLGYSHLLKIFNDNKFHSPLNFGFNTSCKPSRFPFIDHQLSTTVPPGLQVYVYTI